MKKSIFILIFMLLLLAASGQSTIVKEGCIKKINEVLSHLPKEGETVAIFDWDDSISSKNGGYEMRERDEHTGTLAVIKSLHEKKIRTMVLTSRLLGVGLKGDKSISPKEVKTFLDDNIKNVTTALRTTDWLDHGALNSNDLKEFSLEPPDSIFEDYVLIQNQIAFAGGALGKGKAIAKMLTESLFAGKPENILFVDNDKKNVDEVHAEFAHRPEKIFLFYYPAPSDRPQCNNENAIK